MQGTLAQLDSRNPVLYVDFPDGRLKFLGTIVYPKNKYMVLRFGQKEVLCEDILENMVRMAVVVIQQLLYGVPLLQNSCSPWTGTNDDTHDWQDGAGMLVKEGCSTLR